MKILILLVAMISGEATYALGNQVRRTCSATLTETVELRHIKAAEELILRRQVTLSRGDSRNIAKRSTRSLDNATYEAFVASIEKVARRVPSARRYIQSQLSKAEVEENLIQFFIETGVPDSHIPSSLVRAVTHLLTEVGPFRLRGLIFDRSMTGQMNKKAKESFQSMGGEAQKELLRYIARLNEQRIAVWLTEVEPLNKENKIQVAQRIMWAENELKEKQESGGPSPAKNKRAPKVLSQDLESYPLDDVVLNLSLLSVIDGQKESFVDWVYSMDRLSSVKVIQLMDLTTENNMFYGRNIKKLHGNEKKSGRSDLWELRLRVANKNFRIIFQKDKKGQVEFLTFGLRRDLDKLIRSAHNLQKS